MKMRTMGAVVVLLAASAMSHAQTYPAKSVRIIVVLAPGCTTVVFTCILAQRFT